MFGGIVHYYTKLAVILFWWYVIILLQSKANSGLPDLDEDDEGTHGALHHILSANPLLVPEFIIYLWMIIETFLVYFYF